ncbi:MAG TPA: D-lyxose/D-mannose family sugar isomerase, partial [Puia sp.]
RSGILVVRLWPGEEQLENGKPVQLKLNGVMKTFRYGEKIFLRAGERITLLPRVGHEFHPESDECIIGEVSTHNDDLTDNFFENKAIGRFSSIVEDEPAVARLVNE